MSKVLNNIYDKISNSQPAKFISESTIFKVLKGIFVYIFSFFFLLFTSILNVFREGINNSKSVFSNENPNRSSLMKKYGFTFLFILILSALLYELPIDAAAFTSKEFTITGIVFFAFLFLIYGLVPFYKSSSNGMLKMFIGFMILVFISGGLYFLTTMNLTTYTIFNYLVNIIFIIGIIVALAIVFSIYSNYLKTLEGWSGFIVYFIFYIPCLFIDFVKYVINEFQMTTNSVYILFIIELLVVLAYLYVPKLLKKVNENNGIILLDNAAFLDVPFSLDTSKLIVRPTDNLIPNLTQINYRKNYALSMWVNINILPENYKSYSKESLIFNYGNGKPMITYVNSSKEDENDRFVFYFTNLKNEKASFSIQLPSQKWHNFVFNYNSNYVDLFINGNLERTFKFTHNTPTYLGTDSIRVGSKDGLNGAICNIRYYTEPLSKYQIINLYNLLVNNNPPTFLNN
jgi:hypothetical protein